MINPEKDRGTERIVGCIRDFELLMEDANSRKKITNNGKNLLSSRGHTLIVLESSTHKICFVDLAGR